MTKRMKKNWEEINFFLLDRRLYIFRKQRFIERDRNRDREMERYIKR